MSPESPRPATSAVRMIFTTCLLVEVSSERQCDERAVEVYGNRAISRAFFTAVATSRSCWVQVLVTLRARVLPRSEMNFRSSVVRLYSIRVVFSLQDTQTFFIGLRTSALAICLSLERN